MFESQKKYHDNYGYSLMALMDLSGAFDKTNHDLLLSKLHVYSVDTNDLELILSYL